MPRLYHTQRKAAYSNEEFRDLFELADEASHRRFGLGDASEADDGDDEVIHGD